jgi:hypothetical protein
MFETENRQATTIKPIAKIYESTLIARGITVFFVVFLILFGCPIFVFSGILFANVNNTLAQSNPSQPIHAASTAIVQPAFSSTTELPNIMISTPDTAAATTTTARISCVNIAEVNLRKSPGYITKSEDDSILHIPCGESVTVIRGPSHTDGLDWWYISWNGYEGWMADHTGTGTIILIFGQ